MVEDAKSVVMARVWAALGHSETKPAPAPPAVNESIARLARPGDDLPVMFQTRAEVVGMKVSRIAPAALFDAIRRLLDEHHAKRICLGLHDPASLKAQLTAAGYEVMVPASRADMDRQFDFDAGITDVHAALAETGTLICETDAAHSRGPSLVQPLHIAILRESDIVPDMIDYWANTKHRDARATPSSIAFITGPSKTADIEGILIVGVHGPQHVHILMVKDS